MKLRFFLKNRLAFWLAIACWSLLVSGGSEAYVICLGHDGHVAVEKASGICMGSGHDTPSDHDTSAHHAHEHNIAPDTHHGSCFDVPIPFVGISYHSVMADYHPSGQLGSRSFCQADFISSQISVPPYSLRPQHQSPPLASSHTIVMLL